MNTATIAVPSPVTVEPMAGRMGWLLLLTALVPLLLAVAGWRYCAPMLNPDSAMGFFVWQSHASGTPWNCLRDIDPSDIARDRHEFLTWWSPGQYELPGLWRQLGFSWGHVILLTALVGCWVEMVGCWFLGREMGLGIDGRAWFAMASILQWHTLYPFGHFRAGDVLLCAATPWMLLWCWRVRDRPWWFAAGIPFLLLGGFYLKLSAALLTVPLFAATALGNAWHLRRRPGELTAWAAATFLAAGASWWALHALFLDRGSNPALAGMASRELFSPLAFALLSPWLAATGAGSLIGHAYFRLGADVDRLWSTGGWLVAPAALATAWFGGRWLCRPIGNAQRTGLLLVVGLGIALLGVLLARGSAIGLDDRYMRPTATVLLLAAAFSAVDHDPRRRRLARLALSAIAAFGVGCAIQRSIGLARMPGRSREQLTQQHLSPAAIAKLTEIDSDGVPRSTLVYVPWPGIGFEIQRQRILLTDDFAVSRTHRWQGRVPKLVMAVTDVMEADGRAARIRAAFVAYRPEEWTVEQVGGWWFWTARDLYRHDRG